MLCRRLGMLLVVALFQKKVRARREEGVRWLSRIDRRDHEVVFGAKAAQHVEDLAGLMHWLPNIPERISEVLEVTSVWGVVHVALNEVPVLNFEVDRTMEFVVVELVMDASLDLVRGASGARTIACMSLEIELYN